MGMEESRSRQRSKRLLFWGSAALLMIWVRGIGNFSVSDSFLPNKTREIKLAIEKTSMTNLWLTTCETRVDSQSLKAWMGTARLVQNISLQPTSSQQKDAIQIQIVNFCDGQVFRSMMLKQQMARKFLQELVNNSTASGKNNETNIVIFTDGDAFFNPWAITPHLLMERYHRARQGKPILFSSEPNCWVGHMCDEDVMQTIYPDATTGSSCPQFLNAGQVMGPAKDLLEMYQYTTELTPNQIYGGERVSDQARVATWYAHHRHMAALDVGSLIFRNFMFGTVDPSTNKTHFPNLWSCGKGYAKKCGIFYPFYTGFLNHSGLSLAMGGEPFLQMHPVPGCPTEPRPFSFHAAGPTKESGLRLLGQLGRALYPK